MSSRWMAFLIVGASVTLPAPVSGMARACRPAELTAGQKKDNATQEKPGESAAAREFKLIPAKHRPVMDLTVEIQKVMPASGITESVTISADLHTNSVMVQGTAGAIAAVEKIADRLDQPAVSPGLVRDERGTSLRISVYRVVVPQSKALQINAEDLGKTAADDVQLSGVLEKLGTTRLLYCCDQRVELGDKPTIRLGAQIPLASAAREKDGGRKASVTYQDQGILVEASGGWRGEQPEQGLVQIRLDISDSWPVELDVDMEPAPPVIQRIKQQFSGPCESGKPIVLVALGSTGLKDSAMLYVTRIEVRRVGERS